MIVNRPVAFDGTPEQARKNYDTHQWFVEGDPADGDVACWKCDSKPWHAAASYPCGVEPPREDVEMDIRI